MFDHIDLVKAVFGRLTLESLPLCSLLTLGAVYDCSILKCSE